MEEIIQFDKHLLLMLNGSDSTYIDGLALTLTKAATWIPLYLSLLWIMIKSRSAALSGSPLTSNTRVPDGLGVGAHSSLKSWLLFFACIGLLVLLAGTVDDEIVKPLVARWRPTHDPQIGSLVDVVNDYRGGRFGFFSAHASNTISVAVFFSLLIRSRRLTIALLIYSLTNCWTRMYLGVHFPGDITVGLIWGTIVGFFVYYLYRSLTQRYPNLQFTTRHRILDNSRENTPTTSAGFDRRAVNVAVVVLMLTFVYAFVRAYLIMDTIH